MSGYDRKLIEHIAELVIKEIIKDQEVLIPVGISNRHVHLNRKDMNTLFGKEYELTRVKGLGQPGQYAAKERVTIKGPKGEFKNVRILGPLRENTQVEISISDGFKLGIKPPVRESGNLKGSPPIEITGPKGSIVKPEGSIAALRHVHMDPDTAKKLNVSDKDIVEVEVPGVRRAVLGNVLVRVSDKYTLEMHVDLDEANACGLKNGDTVKIVKKG